MNTSTKTTPSTTNRTPTIRIRRSQERGHANHGWLDSRHTFSFANYYDPRFMGFSDLRVINEDRVDPGQGFLPHGHRDMEIISYVVSGGLAHRDSTGSGGIIEPGMVQVMSAGQGVRHSEMNASRTEPVHFLQIWIEPAERGTEAGYAERTFEATPGATLLVSPDGREESLRIGQNADLHRIVLGESEVLTLPRRLPNTWIQVVRGQLQVHDLDARSKTNGTVHLLETGDGAAITGGLSELTLSSERGAEALIFDLR